VNRRSIIREDQADIRVSIDGKSYGDSWNSAQGGNLDADSQKARAGGMGKEMSVGGPASRGDLTVGINMSDIVAGWHPELESKVGHGEVTVSLHWLDQEGNHTGAVTTRKGVVDQANLPDMGTGNAVAQYELVVDCDEQAA
jgi:hypothetical protein